MVDLRNRPLLDTARDRSRFVGREDTLERLVNAQRLGFNTLLLGERGAGATTLLQYAARVLRETHDETVAYIRAGGLSTSQELYASIVAALDNEETSHGSWAELGRALENAGEVLLIVDGLEPAIIHEVFGRQRDGLWEHPDALWLVSAHTEDEAIVLLPPADAFFEAVIRLAPMPAHEIRLILDDREALGPLGANAQTVIDRSRGNPTTALRLAREALEGGWGDQSGALTSDAIAQIGDQLGAPAQRLAEQLARLGSSSPSDARLLDELGWSRARAYQVFADLESEGWVVASKERNGKPGRPRQLYRMKAGAV